MGSERQNSALRPASDDIFRRALGANYDRRELFRLSGGAAAATLFALAGFGGTARAQTPGPKPGGTLICATPFDLFSIYNPLLSQTDPLIFSQLWRFDANLVPQPELAASYEVSPDGTVYTIHLRSDATWHDGQPVTADDVVFTVQTVLDPKVNFNYRFALQVDGKDIKAEAVDAHTVKFTLPGPDAPLVAHLTAPWVLQIAPKHLLAGQDLQKTSFNRNPVGSGPFKFKEQVDGDHQTLERYDNYFEGKPLLDQVITRPITDLQARLAAFQAGDIDVDLREEDNISTKQFAAVSGATAYILDTPYVQQLTLNNADPLFADSNVRQAIAHALDRESMVRTVIGESTDVARSVIGQKHWAYNGDVPTYDYNADKAKSLLDQAGWTVGGAGIREKGGQKFSFVNQPWRDFERNYAPLIQQYLKAVGIDMQIQTVPDFATVTQIRQSGKAQSLFFGCIDYEPGELFQYFHSSQVPPTGQNHAPS
jgi:peptide/nickel transport system substrate-binding protein